MDIWNKVCTTPETAKKKITGGRLNGMTDINPMWRLRRLTEVFGACGDGWKYDVVNVTPINGADGEVMVFLTINLYYYNKTTGLWSEPIPGIGGSMLVEKEKNGLHNNDEAYKMALSDAIGTACKALGMSEDVYMSGVGGSKYAKPAEKMETVEDAAGYKLTFGKYSGNKLGDIYKSDRDYLLWLKDNERTDPTVRKAIEILIEAVRATRNAG